MHSYLYAKASPPNYVDRWGHHSLASDARDEMVDFHDYCDYSGWEIYKRYVGQSTPKIVGDMWVHYHRYAYARYDWWMESEGVYDGVWGMPYGHFSVRYTEPVSPGDGDNGGGSGGSGGGSGGSGGGGGTSPPQPTPEEIAAGKFDEAVQLGGLSPYETTPYTHAASPYPTHLHLSDDLAPRLRIGDWNPQRNPAGEDVLSMVIGGDIRDAFEVITGRDMVTGVELSTAARVIAVAGFFVPVVSGALIRRVATRVGIEIAEEVGERVAREVAEEAAEEGAERIGKEVAEQTTEKLYHYTSADSEMVLGMVNREGLSVGRSSGKVFATPAGHLSPMQAQIDLALPPNRGLPEHLIEIDLPTLRARGIEVPDPTLVTRNFNMPGGGLEVIFDEALPSEALKLLR